jgi:hypothetical protein
MMKQFQQLPVNDLSGRNPADREERFRSQKNIETKEKQDAQES